MLYYKKISKLVTTKSHFKFELKQKRNIFEQLQKFIEWLAS